MGRKYKHNLSVVYTKRRGLNKLQAMPHRKLHKCQQYWPSYREALKQQYTRYKLMTRYEIYTVSILS